MPHTAENPDLAKGIILGAILVGRTRELPVNYFPDVGVVRVGLRSIGEAKSLAQALKIAKSRKKFRPVEKFRHKAILGTG